LIVVAIIGLLVSISIPAYRNYVEKTKSSQGLLALSVYKSSVTICYMKSGGFTDCDGGVLSIPDNFDFIQNSSSLENKINGLQKVDVNNGKIEVIFDAFSPIDGKNIEIVFFPFVNDNGSTINWNAQCSIGAEEYFDFC